MLTRPCLPVSSDIVPTLDSEKPLCPVFGQCGGCQFQDWTYPAELKFKQNYLSQLIKSHLGEKSALLLESIVPSQQAYHYRHVLDINLLRIRSGEVFIGFSPGSRNRIIPVEACPIARTEISDFLPQLKKQALARLTPHYRCANLVVKTGTDGRVFWGGIGKKSLELEEKDYLWAELNGQRIHYSLNTFFQANIGILPRLLALIESFGILDSQTVFYDLYGGVGLFGLAFSKLVRRVILIEENVHAIKIAEYNQRYNQLANFHIVSGRVEERIFHFEPGEKTCVMVDPPRAGLSPNVLELLSAKTRPQALFYLSCNPETFMRDVAFLVKSGWEISRVIPFDFFPRTRHVEILGVLRPKM